jgi:glycosyltransferase involved in cell wall biosynthesis
MNGERFLEQTIQSVLAQRADGIELEYIVLDGASTDGSLGIIRRYRDRINVMISEPDKGPAFIRTVSVNTVCNKICHALPLNIPYLLCVAMT